MIGPYGVVFAGIRQDSVSLLRFPFLSHVHIFSREMSLIHIYLTPPLGQDMTQGQFLSGV